MYRIRFTSLFVLISVAVFNVAAKNIHIHNITKNTLYAAVYERPLIGSSVVRKTDVVPVDSLGFSLLKRPKRVVGAHRLLAIAPNERDLLDCCTKKMIDRLPTINVGTMGVHVFDHFYAVQKHDRLKLYNPMTLKISDIKHDLLANIEKAFDAYRSSLVKNSLLVTENPYKEDIAQVRIGNQVCDQESMYLEKRMQKVRTALEELLQTELNGSYIPKIACINSGGGVRAMISCAGFHVGLQEVGLLDAITYDVGLSGGSWFLALWMHSGFEVHAFKALLADLVEKDLRLAGRKEAKLFADALFVRFGLRQPVTLVNTWGALLANRYLAPCDERRQHVLWSDMVHRIADASVPFPILSAISGSLAESYENRPKVPWVEFTPFEVGGVGDWLGNVFVPMWAFGRKFEDGVSVDMSPQLDLGGIMGICGSAFAFSFARGYDKEIKNLPVIGTIADFVFSKIDTDTIGKKRITVGKVHNFAKGITGVDVSEDKYLKMVDGGITFNLPYPPVSGHGPRKADIFIFCDASSNVEKKGPENLHMIERYAKEHDLKFPTIDTKRVAQRSISIFKNESDPTVPLVIYIPRAVVDDVVYSSEVPQHFSTSFSTTKFAYNKEEFDGLSAVTKTNLTANKDRIIKELREHIQRNGGF